MTRVRVGIDLVQIVPELVTNADAAIAASGRSRGRIEVRFGAPEPAFLAACCTSSAGTSPCPKMSRRKSVASSFVVRLPVLSAAPSA